MTCIYIFSEHEEYIAFFLFEMNIASATTKSTLEVDTEINKAKDDHKPTWRRRLDEAKSKHRPTMKDWAREGFAARRSADLSRLTEQRAYEFCKNIDRVHCDHMSEKDFIKRYEEPALPVVISGVPLRQDWTAGDTWTDWEWLRTQLGERLFKVGEDDDGYKVKVKFKYFLQYMRENNDDSPLYVFDSTFDDDDVSRCLLRGYNVPIYFRDDLFSLVGEKRRPPYRWWLCGPKRSGTCVHIDPLGTSAWNTLLVGRKRWVLFPPSAKKRVVKASDFVHKGEDDEAVNYFVDQLPRLLRRMRQDEREWEQSQGQSLENRSGSSPHSAQHSSSTITSSSSSGSDSSSDSGRQNPRDVYGCHSSQVIEFTQYPGETVFVPGDWWHAVLNLDDTVAITQNFCSITNFKKVWIQTRAGRKKMACKWLTKLQIQYPALGDIAVRLNREDGFLMYYEAKAAKEARRKERKLQREEGRVVSESKNATTTINTLSVEEEKPVRQSFKHESKHDAEKREAKRKLEQQGTYKTTDEDSNSSDSTDMSELSTESLGSEHKKKRVMM